MNELLPVALAAGVLGYALLKRRLNRVAQPLRLELAERGEALLADPAVPQRLKNVIEFELDSAFGRALWLLLAIVVIPFVSLWLAATGGDDGSRGLNDRLRGQFDEFNELSARLSFLNDPIFMTFVSVWLVVWFAIATLVGAIAGRAANFMTAPAVMASVHSRLHTHSR